MKEFSVTIYLSIVIAVSMDCPNVINFAYGLNLHLIKPTIYSQLQEDCCAVSGITCVVQRVTKIQWISFGFNGTMNGTALPPGLTALDISGGKITGSVPPLPDTITLLVLKNNLLSGNLPPFPSGLAYLYINGNQLTGDVPTVPRTVREFYIGNPGEGNYLTGSILLNKPRHVYIQENLITDVMITDTTVLGTLCNLSNNPLLGSPHLAALTMCIKNDLFSLPTTSRPIFTSVTSTVDFPLNQNSTRNSN